jgi:hypothetical protein
MWLEGPPRILFGMSDTLAMILLTVACSKHGGKRAPRLDFCLSGVTPENRE